MSVSVDDPVVERHTEAAAPEPVVARTRGRRRTVLLALVAMPMWALVCAASARGAAALSRVGPVLAPFAAVDKPLDVLFVWLVLVLLWCVTGRLWASMGILLGLTATLSAVNAAKMEILTEPLYPSDYQFLGSTSFLLEMVSPASVVAAVLGLVLLAVGTVAAGRFMGRRYPRVRRTEDPRAWARLLGVRVLVGAITTVVLASALQFNEPGNLWRRAFDAQGAVWQPCPAGAELPDQRLHRRRCSTTCRPTPMRDACGLQRRDHARDRRAVRRPRRPSATRAAPPGAIDDVNVVAGAQRVVRRPARLRAGSSIDAGPDAADPRDHRGDLGRATRWPTSTAPGRPAWSSRR